MKTITRMLTGAAVTAMLAVGAAPAQAQYYDYDRYERERTIQNVVSGVAAVAGAVTGATRGYSPYGYGYGNYGYAPAYGFNSFGYAPYSYGNYSYMAGEQAAVTACGYQAQRYGAGAVRITDVDRRSRSRFRVHGVIDNGMNGYGYNRYGYGRDMRFSCTARYDGRVTDFDTRRL
jgi:hypothetical protein